jgi:hypothetical protein
MDEQAIIRAAEEAMHDLQIDCQVKEVCRSSDGDQWCIQFSGKYGQFCDEFKNQFGKENSSRIIQEKIKMHLLKQVTKIRSSTGKSRRPKVNIPDERPTQSSIISAPLEMVGEALSRASQIAGGIVGQVAGVADAARETVANLADSISPPTVEIGSDVPVEEKRRRRATARKSAKATKATSRKASKATRRVSRPASKKAKKAGKAEVKSGRKAKKTGKSKR